MGSSRAAGIKKVKLEVSKKYVTKGLPQLTELLGTGRAYRNEYMAHFFCKKNEFP